ncbi:hypothetical protein CONLIGDRAFT_685339 [Coniochaeta ligniaria NRRL 30616]|uniref:Uncharacterized protein n=1 Tax=Coniochaeta ligniaria NRRL 30616 TaxID=1408157 RepID=A0A1J7IA77_9PEZI|nr:hypothetical protein CONLIGDRAFT_685339 [Coniochaeta ligniaria NRRL 30616]
MTQLFDSDGIYHNPILDRALSQRVGDHHHIAKLFPSRDPSSNGPSASSPSSSRPVFPNRRSVEDEAGLPADLTEKELVRFTDEVNQQATLRSSADNEVSSDAQRRQQSPPPQYPASEASTSSPPFRPPPPFSSLFTDAPSLDQSAAALAVLEPCEPYKPSVSDADTLAVLGESSSAAPAYAPSDQQVVPGSSNAARFLQDETKRALPQDTKAGSSRKEDEAEPPPAYSEGSSPLQSFTYLMAAAGGAASIITQVQQGGPTGGINTIGDVGADETITMDLRGTRFTLSRDELLTLPEFVLLSLFPNGLFPEGHMGGFADGDAVQVDVSSTVLHQASPSSSPSAPPDPSHRRNSTEVLLLPNLGTAAQIRNILSNLDIHIADTYPHVTQYDPASLQYMLDFFRNVAQTIPTADSASASQDGGEGGSGVHPLDPVANRAAGDDSSKRAGIIVLREDLDFYAIPPKKDIDPAEMMEVKRAAARALLRQDGIFSGLKKSDEPGTTEAHLIEMLTAGGFNHDDKWGHRAGEPNKAVVCSLALARLRSDIRGNEMGSNAVGMAQKLLLFWRKPARRCWWEGVELEDVEGLPEGTKLKVWIRRVWTLEMSVIGLR